MAIKLDSIKDTFGLHLDVSVDLYLSVFTQFHRYVKQHRIPQIVPSSCGDELADLLDLVQTGTTCRHLAVPTTFRQKRRVGKDKTGGLLLL